MSGRIIIAAGGTGGHLYPAEALAHELVARSQSVVLATDDRGARFSDSFGGIDVFTIRSASPTGRGAIGAIAAGATIATGAIQARRLLRRLNASIVVGFGGYPSLPTLLAAPGMGARVVLHEQNAVLGRVNRLMLRKSDLVALSFAGTEGLLAAPEVRAVVTGNPVRAAVRREREHPYGVPGSDTTFQLLVFGGSQGAKLFSEVVPNAVRRLSDELRQRLRIIQQCRPEDGDRVAASYRDIGVDADVQSFFDDLPRLIGAAHLVIARSGAGTVSELAVAGRPSLLVPYNFATDNHQTANAKALIGSGGAALIAEDKFTPAELAARIDSLARRPDVLQRMAERARAVGQPDAAVRLADLVLSLANGNRPNVDTDDRRVAA